MGVLTPLVMMKLAILLCLASLSPSLALNCNECINEMHGLNYIIKQGANDIMAFLAENYCPAQVGYEEEWENHLVKNYVGMLWMVVEHFFVDGASHICQAWGFLTLLRTLSPTPARSVWRGWRWWGLT